MRKQHLKNGTCKVTFDLTAEAGVKDVHLCGEFNDWSPTATPMTRRKDGTFLDGDRWENDWAADDYVPNEHGGDDAVVVA